MAGTLDQWGWRPGSRGNSERAAPLIGGSYYGRFGDKVSQACEKLKDRDLTTGVPLDQTNERLWEMPKWLVKSVNALTIISLLAGGTAGTAGVQRTAEDNPNPAKGPDDSGKILGLTAFLAATSAFLASCEDEIADHISPTKILPTVEAKTTPAENTLTLTPFTPIFTPAPTLEFTPPPPEICGIAPESLLLGGDYTKFDTVPLASAAGWRNIFSPPGSSEIPEQIIFEAVDEHIPIIQTLIDQHSATVNRIIVAEPLYEQIKARVALPEGIQLIPWLAGLDMTAAGTIGIFDEASPHGYGRTGPTVWEKPRIGIDPDSGRYTIFGDLKVLAPDGSFYTVPAQQIGTDRAAMAIVDPDGLEGSTKPCLPSVVRVNLEGKIDGVLISGTDVSQPDAGDKVWKTLETVAMLAPPTETATLIPYETPVPTETSLYAECGQSFRRFDYISESGNWPISNIDGLTMPTGSISLKESNTSGFKFITVSSCLLRVEGELPETIYGVSGLRKAILGFWDIYGKLHEVTMLFGGARNISNNQTEEINPGLCTTNVWGTFPMHCKMTPAGQIEAELISILGNKDSSHQLEADIATSQSGSTVNWKLKDRINANLPTTNLLFQALKTGSGFPELPSNYFVYGFNFVIFNK